MILSRYERVIAKRYLLPARARVSSSSVASISLVAVMLGVAALIIVMSVMNGFRAELFDKIVGLNGHCGGSGLWWALAELAGRSAPPGAAPPGRDRGRFR
jgi:lipoprotein-releasing system permease protein